MAKGHQISQEEFNNIDHTDALAWNIRLRLIAVVFKVPHILHNRVQREVGPRPSKQVVFKDLGHHLVYLGDNKGYRCQRCGQTWRGIMLPNQQPCPGH